MPHANGSYRHYGWDRRPSYAVVENGGVIIMQTTTHHHAIIRLHFITAACYVSQALNTVDSDFRLLVVSAVIRISKHMKELTSIDPSPAHQDTLSFFAISLASERHLRVMLTYVIIGCFILSIHVYAAATSYVLHTIPCCAGG